MTVNALNPVREFKQIILHHTATETYNDKIGREYHYVILQSGEVKKTRQLEDIVGSTRNYEANRNGVQIALVGNFNNYPPTEAQLKALKQLIKDIEKKKGSLIIKRHSDVGTTACPGKMFEIEKYDLGQYEGLGNKTVFSLSRYYSVMEGQKRYYNGKSYLEDKMMNCGEGDCLITANGHKLTEADKYKTVACDSKYLGKRLFLEGIGEVVCNDVGGAIKGKRIDVRCGIADNALDTWYDCPTGQVVGYWLD